MALAAVTYQGNGTSGPFSVPFPYIAQEHIHVYVDLVEVAYTFVTASTVSIPSNPGVGTEILIRRETPKQTPIVDWANTANLTEENLDLQSLQVLYAMQESVDLAEATSVEAAEEFAEDAAQQANIAIANAAQTGTDAAATAADVVTTNANVVSCAASQSAAAQDASDAQDALSGMLSIGRLHEVGDVKFHTAAAVPPGWRRIKRDPQALNKSEYPELNAKYAAEGYPYGSTTTTFNIPGGAGLFLRAWDDTSTYDPDAAARLSHADFTTPVGNILGSLQHDDFEQHGHTGQAESAGDHSHGANQPTSNGFYAVSAGGTGLSNQYVAGQPTSQAGSHIHNLNINPNGGNETRPGNIAFPLIILVNPAEAAAAHTPFGLPYSWNTGTADADPGTGLLRLNNAAPASATELYVSKTGANSADLAAVWSLINAITAANRAVLTVFHAATPSNMVAASVTGPVVDATTYLKVPITVLSVGGTFSADAPLCIQIGLAGAEGQQGAQGIQGVQGDQGDTGWSPTFSIETDSARRVLKIVDWQGGEGTKPPIDKYIGPTGLEDLITNGVDIRGPAGVGSGDVVGPEGGVVDNEIALFDSTTGKLVKGSGGTTIASLTTSILDTVRDGVAAAYDTLAELAAGLATKLDIAGGQTLTGGFAHTPHDLGTITTGTVQPDEADGNLQFYTNNGAHTLAPMTNNGVVTVKITNGASAVIPTTTGFTRVVGDPFVTTSGKKFVCDLRVIGGDSVLCVVALP